MAAPVPNPTPYPEIPDKLYFRIGEVSELAGVKPYVLRYWETEFAGIGPKKSGSNHRLYRRKDVELILDIKHLLYEKRYTIEGARKLLMGEGRAAARAETRGLAKPVQAASAVATPVAVAVGGAASPTASNAATPPPKVSRASASAVTSAPPAAKPATPKAELVGSIRKELLSLLDLLAN
jgi:DNA-binding transcriptional MerR regulator